MNILFYIAGIVWLLLVTRRLIVSADLRSIVEAFSSRARNRILNENLAVLSAHNNFFSNLSTAGKEQFINRCGWFISSKNFIGMEGLEVTPEMKVRIAATAVQVTFGLKDSLFSHYHTVKLFPSTFYSRLHDRYLKGGASTSGVLFFSWEDFKHGFADPTDKYNLGLHEMGHALRLQLKHGKEFDQRFASYVDQWFELALPEFERMNEGNTSFLREYGATNMEEFFAVCIEHFFEVPNEFKSLLPDIYNHLCFLLNLDPTREKDDYRLAPGFVESINSDKARMPLPLKLQRSYKYDSWNWSFNIILAGLFLGTPAILIFQGDVLYTKLHVLLIFAFVTAIVTTFRKFFMKKGIVLFHHLVFFCVAGAGPLSCAAILASNYFIKISYSVSAYRVEGYFTSFEEISGRRQRVLTVKLQNGSFDKFVNIRSVPVEQFKNIDFKKPVYLAVATSTGLWGLQNFEGSRLLQPAQSTE